MIHKNLQEQMNLEDEIKNLIHVWFIVIASLCYCYYVTTKLPKGLWRLLSLAPIFYIFTLVPFYLTSAYFTLLTATLITWFANFRLFLFSFNQGPLSSGPPKSLPMFIAVAALFMQIKSEHKDPTLQKSKILLLNLATEIPLSAILVKIIYEYKEYLHPYILLVMYCCFILLITEIVVASSNLMARSVFGLELDPPFDKPYLSTSAEEFWSRRWNLIAGNILRQTIYKPTRLAFGKELGALATFLVSGLMHELIIWYVIRGTPTWEITLFFVVQWICVVLESAFKVLLAEKKWRLPWFVGWLLTFGIVVPTSFLLFFPPIIRNGVDMRIIQEFNYAGEIVKERMLDVWLQVCPK